MEATIFSLKHWLCPRW